MVYNDNIPGIDERIQYVLFVIQRLWERIIDPFHLFASKHQLMCLSKIIAMLIGRYKMRKVRVSFIDRLVVRDAVNCVMHRVILVVNINGCASPVGQAVPRISMRMKIAFYPAVSPKRIIGIIKKFARKWCRCIEVKRRTKKILFDNKPNKE